VSDSQPEVETLRFKIGLTGTYWDKKPKYTVKLNGNSIQDGFCDDSIKFVEFEAELADNQDHLLEIRLENKTNFDTFVENNEITKDLLLNIESIEIDDIELGELKWSQSSFVADDNARPKLDQCVNLGWNGSYQLKFTSPFYLWLLENM